MRLACAKYSDPGSRGVNEDSVAFFEKEDSFCAVIADGLGGHGQGDVASQTVVEAAGIFFRDKAWHDNYLGEMFCYCNDVLAQKQRESGAVGSMKTTLVVAVFHDGTLSIGHCGDSRGYLFRKGRLVKRTLDHSVPQALVMSGEIKERAIRNHPDRSRLLRCLGIKWSKPMYEIDEELDIRGGESLLLCTDGFWELIVERDMGLIDRFEREAEKKLSKMRGIVEKHGKNKNMDNNSAILITIDK